MKMEDYIKMPYRLELVEDKEEGGYVASYPELPGCITLGDTLEDAVNNANDAKREWLLAAIEEGIDIPLPDAANSFSGQFRLRIPRTLHKSLAERSRSEGISLNQYCIYLLSMNNALYRH